MNFSRKYNMSQLLGTFSLTYTMFEISDGVSFSHRFREKLSLNRTFQDLFNDI